MEPLENRLNLLLRRVPLGATWEFTSGVQVRCEESEVCVVDGLVAVDGIVDAKPHGTVRETTAKLNGKLLARIFDGKLQISPRATFQSLGYIEIALTAGYAAAIDEAAAQ